MEQKFRTSFIPKQESVLSGLRPTTGHRFSVFSIIAIVLFTASVVGSISVFIYHRSLVGDIGDMRATLIAAQNSLEPTLVDSLISLDQKIEASKRILSTHTSVTQIFDLLEEQTIKNVRFKNLEFAFENNTMTITMSGEAKDFLAVAAQSDLWNSERRFSSPVFSGFKQNEDGTAEFSFKSPLTTSSFLYKNLFPTTNVNITPTATTSEQVPETSGTPSQNDIEITPVPEAEGILPDLDF